jgi:predicted nucleotidyltransferase
VAVRSCARGETRQHSDIDIAILPRDELPNGFFGELEANIEDSDIPYDVELVDLQTADPGLVDAVRREGAKWRDWSAGSPRPGRRSPASRTSFRTLAVR